jgi:Pyridoxamine 5'-phosphate oxidase
MPDYGIVPADQGSGLLPWEWAVKRLTGSHDYWLASVRSNGRPHVMPVWAVWLHDALWFSTGPRSRKALNIGRDSRVTVTTDNALTPVVLDGVASLVDDRGLVEEFAAASNGKYEVDYDIEFYVSNCTFRVTPERVFGLDEGDFTGSPTRWSFPR